MLAGAVAGEHDAVGFGVEALEEFFDEARFYTTGFLRVNQVTHDGFEPGVFTHAEYDHRALLHFELIHWRVREYFAKDCDLT